MNTSPHRSACRRLAHPRVESLEARRLLSLAVPAATAAATAATPAATPPATAGIILIPPILIAPTTTIGTNQPVLTGRTIHAITEQPFRAVIGTIRNFGRLPPGYTPHGEIDWGDGTPTSEAKLVRQSDGSIAVIGAHTYAKAGSDDITVVVSAQPPPWSDALVRLIGTFHSKADVIAANGGVTVNATAGVSFTARLGFFRTSYDASTLSAVIDWGDGTQSQGKIVTLPTAGPVPSYAVDGSHSYFATASYLVHITVYSSYPPPIASPTPTAPRYLVAEIDSVIDVLPPMYSTQQSLKSLVENR